ncbi:MAG: T9SS type A sorting domain-containing protein, partial [Candidatus Carbobacillus sp.]|nr:T9SS type A sorting domain-containing protein [Candidatus Carbobacillus sp.]
IESVNYVGTTQILLNLAFDGTDFDTDVNNFSFTIAAAELTGDQDLTSNDLSILAINEDASIWTHLLTAVDMEYTLGDNVSPWINMEIGQTTWESAEIGFGNDNEDINSFDWLFAEWYEDGEGNNKKVHAQIDIPGSNGTGTYYYVGRAKATPTSNWSYANNEVWSDTDVFAPEYTITINPVPDPITFEANALDGTRIGLSWTADATHNNIIILAKEGSEINAIPTQGTLYAVNDEIEDATVIYKGSAGTFNHMNLNQLTTYYYKAFTINNNYYSDFLTASATTTDEESCSFEISLGNDTAICGGTGIVLNSGLTVSPYGDSLTITYNASVTGELVGEEKVYLHSAAEMAPENGWEYITGNWGDDDGVGLMTEISDDVWQISFVPVDYYGYPAEQNIYGILMKFRNADGTVEAGNAAGEDIWINMSVNPPVSSFSAVQTDFISASITSITWSTGSHEPSISISSSGEYWVSATDNQGCIGTDTINIGIQALPQADLGLDTTLCTGEDILLYPGDFEEYLWQDNSTDTSLLVTSSGTYSVTVTDEFGCQGFDVVQIQVVNPPVAFFTYNELENNTVEFIDESTDAETYAWDFTNDGIIDSNTAGNVQYTYPEIGQYGVSLIVENACSADTYSTTILLISIQDIFVENFSIYPIPISDYLYIESDVQFDNTSFGIFDISGKKIINQQAESTITKIDFNDFPAGMYILEINTDSEITNLKIIKQ